MGSVPCSIEELRECSNYTGIICAHSQVGWQGTLK